MENQEKLTYKEAYNELQTILSNIENNNVDVAILSDNLKRASVLINFCKENLSKIEIDVNKLISEIEQV